MYQLFPICSFQHPWVRAPNVPSEAASSAELKLQAVSHRWKRHGWVSMWHQKRYHGDVSFSWTTPGWDIYRHKQPYCVWKWKGTLTPWGIWGEGNIKTIGVICMQKLDWSKWGVERNIKPLVFFESILIPLSNYKQLLDFFKSKYDSYNYCIMIIFIKGLNIL